MKLFSSANQKPKKDPIVLAEMDLEKVRPADMYWHEGHKAVTLTFVGRLPNQRGKYDFEIHLTSKDIQAIQKHAMRK